MKNILTITFNRIDIPWGPAVHYLELWRAFVGLENNNFKVKGIAPKGSASPIIEPNFPIEYLPQPNIPKLRQLVFDMVLAVYLFSVKKDTIIYVRNASVALCSLFVIKLRKLKMVLELNGISDKDTISSKERTWISKISVLSECKLIQYAHATIAVSDGIKEYAIHVGGRNVISLENGISPSFFKTTKTPTKEILRIVYVGTFTPWDGAHRIVTLAASFPNVEFHLYGDGAAVPNLKAKKTDNVCFHGNAPYSSLPEIYSQYDAGIVLYDIERNDMKISSLKTLEYAASGLPIFSSDVPGQEFIRDNGIGYLSNLKDVNSDFQTFIAHLEHYELNAVKFRPKLFTNKSWTTVAAKTKDFIENC